MKLIVGGAYQGKLDFARETFGLGADEVFTCRDGEIDFSCRCIDKLEEFTYACVQQGKDALAYLKERESQWENSIFICQDISCGVVPLGADLRQWRQETGLVCQYLCGKAESVSRIFCGLEQKLK